MAIVEDEVRNESEEENEIEVVVEEEEADIPDDTDDSDVMEEIEREGIKIYPLPDCDSDEDEDYKEQVRQLKAAVPFAVCGAGQQLEVRGRRVRGRLYPWGVVEVENPEHCDFIKLRTMLITHMQDLQEVTQEVHYENYRSERLARSGQVPKRHTSTESGLSEVDTNGMMNGSEAAGDRDRVLREKEAELRRMQEMLDQMQRQMNMQAAGGASTTTTA